MANNLESLTNDKSLKKGYEKIRDKLGLIDSYRPAATIFCATRLLDGISTHAIISAVGSTAEKMPVARYFIEKFGNDYGILLHQTSMALPILLGAYMADNVIKNKKSLMPGSRILNGVSIFSLGVIANNVIQNWRLAKEGLTYDFVQPTMELIDKVKNYF